MAKGIENKVVAVSDSFCSLYPKPSSLSATYSCNPLKISGFSFCFTQRFRFRFRFSFMKV